MEEKKSGQVCPRCGYKEGSALESLLHLSPGTILDGKYLLGRALGQGGFGITYIAWDTTLNIKLAIKEYLPQQLATRIHGQSTVTVYKTSLSDQFIYGLSKFLEEARALARFIEHPNVVSVRDFFEANGTAYLVMNYLEGLTLEQYLAGRGGKITVDEALEIFVPVLDALKEVHSIGMLHRDISPDNLLVNTRGQVVLIDFGAARQAMGEKSRSLSVIMKAGYSPVEQYQSKGKQGPWTDIYALAATFYRSITAHKPPESVERITEDLLKPPSYYGIEMEAVKEEALIRALSVKAADRFKDVESFREKLISEETVVSEAVDAGIDQIIPGSEPIETAQADALEQKSGQPEWLTGPAGRWMGTLKSIFPIYKVGAARETKQRHVFNLVLMALISMLVVLNGWVYLAGMSVERTILSRSYYQGLAGDTAIIADIHQELESTLALIIEESVTRELEKQVGTALTEPEKLIIRSRLQLITTALAEVFYEEWFEDQFLLVSDDLLALLTGEQENLTAVIDLGEGKDRMQEKLIASLETLPAGMRGKLSIPADRIEIMVDQFMTEINFPEKLQMVYLEDTIGNDSFAEIEMAVSTLQRARGLYRFLPYLIFILLFICSIPVAGVTGALKWFGAATLFFSTTFLGAAWFFQQNYVPELFTGIEIENGWILSPDPVLGAAADYTFLRILTMALVCAAAGALFLVGGIVSEKYIRKNNPDPAA